MKDNIILIGFMGTGKTTIGKRLASSLNLEFFDTDEDIENVTGLTIEQIFSRLGQRRFRSEEYLAVKRAVSKDNRVIATGGGVILDENNLELLKAYGKLILLKTRPETIHARIARKGNRPLLGKNPKLEDIVRLLEEREPIYNQAADYVVQTDDLEYEEVVEKIIEMLNAGGDKKHEDINS